MSIFRVEKNKNYTVISNYHLRDKNLSLKTIGLLSIILSLPDNWDYSQAGLAAICKDGEDSIRSGLKELEKYGYLERERERDENGRMRGIIYRVYEVPKNQRQAVVEIPKNTHCDAKKTHSNQQSMADQTYEAPRLENPMLVNPSLETPASANPKSALPTSVKWGQLIKDKQSTNKQNTDLLINQSINQRNQAEEERGLIGGRMVDSKYEQLRNYIHENVNYDFFRFKLDQIDDKFENKKISIDEYELQTSTYDIKKLDQVIGYMLDVLSSINNDPIKIGDEIISREVVKSKLMKIKMTEIQKVIVELNTNPSIKNPKKYAISMLYNS